MKVVAELFSPIKEALSYTLHTHTIKISIKTIIYNAVIVEWE